MHLNTVAFEHDMPVLIDKAFSSGLLPGDLSGRRGSAISSFNAYLGRVALSEELLLALYAILRELSRLISSTRSICYREALLRELGGTERGSVAATSTPTSYN